MSHLGFQLRNPQHVIMASTRQQSSGLVSRSSHARWVGSGPVETAVLGLPQTASSDSQSTVAGRLPLKALQK